jgi:hypothetical protein
VEAEIMRPGSTNVRVYRPAADGRRHGHSALTFPPSRRLFTRDDPLALDPIYDDDPRIDPRPIGGLEITLAWDPPLRSTPRS